MKHGKSEKKMDANQYFGMMKTEKKCIINRKKAVRQKKSIKKRIAPTTTIQVSVILFFTTSLGQTPVFQREVAIPPFCYNL
jgi:hypothetical protein